MTDLEDLRKRVEAWALSAEIVPLPVGELIRDLWREVEELRARAPVVLSEENDQLIDENKGLRAEVKRLQGTPERYWEGRWRDEVGTFEPVDAKELRSRLCIEDVCKLEMGCGCLLALEGLYRQRKT